jgi:Mn-dependent DtxR family transcriptional regulator
MPITRRDILEHVATVSDAQRRQTTSKAALTARLGVDRQTLESHIEALAACELVRAYPDGRIRITTTGEELLALETEDVVIIDSEE